VIKPKEARSPTDDDLNRMMDELELQLYMLICSARMT